MILDNQSRKRLSTAVNRYERQPRNKPAQRRRNVTPSNGLAAYIAKTGGSPIAARSGTTPGSGEVTIWRITSGGILEATDRTETAYNIAESAVSANAYIQVKAVSGRLIVDFEDCEA